MVPDIYNYKIKHHNFPKTKYFYNPSCVLKVGFLKKKKISFCGLKVHWSIKLLVFFVFLKKNLRTKSNNKLSMNLDTQIGFS